MDEKHYVVETDNMKNVMRDMLSKIDEILQMLNTTDDRINETKKVFDTPAAEYFRKRVNDYIEEKKLYIKNDLIPSIEVLNSISLMYETDSEEEINFLKKSALSANKKIS
ncbi:MAG: hypothetical protein IJO57_02450 [Bacilli bacterium]|nr:hypothetical protein [Bacilli bacterium]